MKILIGKIAGFCYGVKRAVETAVKLKEENPDKNIYILGELIHNTDVINELDKMGIKTIYEVPKSGDGICIIRSHGAAPEVLEQIRNAGFELVDLTCPDVKKVQQRAIELAKKHGVFCGISAGANVCAAKVLAEKYPERLVVAIIPDSGERYLSVW